MRRAFFHNRSNTSSEKRRGAALVEFAIVVPVFGLFLAAMVEFGHVYMVQTTLRGAAKKAARLGIGDGVTSADVSAEATRIVQSACRTDGLTVLIKDAGLFDTSTEVPDDLDFDDLPNIELVDAEPRQLFIVRLELPYDDVALFPPFWVDNIRLHSQSVMRHE
ncbi:pilus assembly protein [bacterium]|uniref:TadE family protein n=1 Tax=Rubinisphaera brasiliensis (strain ATCC 49424 / DSM 5305 / JCM 21570 / IAM 15109 / NBRC 103401 / IFAM 1448) TaxID=756272 RepID=F0SQN3_RUBBR|nr:MULTISPECIES: TadE/TadG family type IV pilus assembly protein [Rubinisphaera]ADY59063.1 TadE family protein [Rubinisphaera brasiliensis DSM 5305]MBB03101.1 pilus assembly protein [Planctomyces sp.]MBR9803803.1 pilus assembly protein [bacterium]